MASVQKGNTMLLHTAGYEGLNIDDFVQGLCDAGVDQIIDVRQYPISRKRGFSKNALASRLAEEGIAYLHIRELGCPKPIREQYKVDANWRRYEQDFVKYVSTQGAALERVALETKTKRPCLVCFEADAAFCHRRLVAEATQTRQPRLKIGHLAIKKAPVAVI